MGSPFFVSKTGTVPAWGLSQAFATRTTVVL